MQATDGCDKTRQQCRASNAYERFRTNLSRRESSTLTAADEHCLHGWSTIVRQHFHVCLAARGESNL